MPFLCFKSWNKNPLYANYFHSMKWISFTDSNVKYNTFYPDCGPVLSQHCSCEQINLFLKKKRNSLKRTYLNFLKKTLMVFSCDENSRVPLAVLETSVGTVLCLFDNFKIVQVNKILLPISGDWLI